MDEVEQNPSHCGESFRDPQILVDHKEVMGCLSGSTLNVLQALGLKLDIFGVGMLQYWFNPCQDTVWSDTGLKADSQTTCTTPLRHPFRSVWSGWVSPAGAGFQ